MRPVRVDRYTFLWAFSEARGTSRLISEMTSRHVWEKDVSITHYLTLDQLSGYAITESGKLLYLFSTVKGRGKDLVKAAISDGADHLWCFDGFLVEFYQGFGFTETRRESNWTVDGPDVVRMAL